MVKGNYHLQIISVTQILILLAYLIYHRYLQFQKVAIVEKYIQGGQGNLSADIVKKLTIPFPSFQEQGKIASFLATIDDKISRTQAQIENTQAYKKGLLQKMFV